MVLFINFQQHKTWHFGEVEFERLTGNSSWKPRQSGPSADGVHTSLNPDPFEKPVARLKGEVQICHVGIDVEEQLAILHKRELVKQPGVAAAYLVEVTGKCLQ